MVGEKEEFNVSHEILSSGYGNENLSKHLV